MMTLAQINYFCMARRLKSITFLFLSTRIVRNVL